MKLDQLLEHIGTNVSFGASFMPFPEKSRINSVKLCPVYSLLLFYF